jgi:hypothetical protein
LIISESQLDMALQILENSFEKEIH